ncbi:MAG TPA: rhodanese-like domain-containing protein [Candidatus Mucispirillum faecigallinarum]|uniref:Rhodanese-like domain-containing protein n=1 Tax=Candidatus Mucispirillum faecigallinarum TaxID=2838699 RepID=A0A9D2KCB1_9BACT|nr:rhodanese-like domain-containing protein [Candidatus Mucispirillum faecigallinarum]
MGFFDMFKLKDINGELEKAKSINGSIILDVRTISEYKDGHIPNSINIPVENIESVASKYKDKSTPFFVYCLSGARSASAARVMNQMGYENVTDMGGIMRYRGEIER